MATNPDRASYFPAIEKKYGQPMSYWFDVMAQIKELKYAEQIAYLRENYGFTQVHANALVLYSRGSTSARRFATLDDFLQPLDDTKRATIRAIIAAISEEYPDLELVIAWNQPMFRLGKQYVFGMSAATSHLLIAPFGGGGILDRFRDRLADYEVNKKTVRVPVDWQVDRQLLCDLVAARLAEIEA